MFELGVGIEGRATEAWEGNSAGKEKERERERRRVLIS